MSGGNIVSLGIFLWIVAVYGILRFFQSAHPYRENSEEAKADDRAQEQALKAWRRKKRNR